MGWGYARSERHRGRSRGTRRCAWCDREFEVFADQGNVKTCGDDCARERHSALISEGRRSAAVSEPLTWGAFESREQARSGLLRALERDGAWWGAPLLGRWRDYHQLTAGQALELQIDLHQAGRVEVREVPGVGTQIRARRP